TAAASSRLRAAEEESGTSISPRSHTPLSQPSATHRSSRYHSPPAVSTVRRVPFSKAAVSEKPTGSCPASSASALLYTRQETPLREKEKPSPAANCPSVKVTSAALARTVSASCWRAVRCTTELLTL